MKKTILFLLALLFCLAAAGCHDNVIIKDTTEITLAEADELPESGVLTDGSKLGILQKIEDEADDTFKGLILTTGSGQHNYPTIGTLSKEGYRTDELIYEFELNETIEFYAQTTPSDQQMNLYIVKNEKDVDYGQLSAADIEDLCIMKSYPVCWATRPDPENYGHLASLTIRAGRHSAGLYNVFFSAPGLRYMVQIRLTDPQ